MAWVPGPGKQKQAPHLRWSQAPPLPWQRPGWADNRVWWIGLTRPTKTTGGIILLAPWIKSNSSTNNDHPTEGYIRIVNISLVGIHMEHSPSAQSSSPVRCFLDFDWFLHWSLGARHVKGGSVATNLSVVPKPTQTVILPFNIIMFSLRLQCHCRFCQALSHNRATSLRSAESTTDLAQGPRNWFVSRSNRIQVGGPKKSTDPTPSQSAKPRWFKMVVEVRSPFLDPPEREEIGTAGNKPRLCSCSCNNCRASHTGDARRVPYSSVSVGLVHVLCACAQVQSTVWCSFHTAACNHLTTHRLLLLLLSSLSVPLRLFLSLPS